MPVATDEDPTNVVELLEELAELRDQRDADRERLALLGLINLWEEE